MKKILLSGIAALTLMGCASSVEDYKQGVGNFPEPTIELPVAGYYVFGELQDMWAKCEMRLNNSQALRAFIYTSPKPWGYKHDESLLKEFVEEFKNEVITDQQCYQLKELAWDKALSETAKGVSTSITISNVMKLPENLATAALIGGGPLVHLSALSTAINASNTLAGQQIDLPKVPTKP